MQAAFGCLQEQDMFAGLTMPYLAAAQQHDLLLTPSMQAGHAT